MVNRTYLVCKPAERDREDGLNDERVQEGSSLPSHATFRTISSGNGMLNFCIWGRIRLPGSSNLESQRHR